MNGLTVLFALAYKGAALALGGYFLWRAYDAFRFQFTGKSRAEDAASGSKPGDRPAMFFLGLIWLSSGLLGIAFGITFWP